MDNNEVISDVLIIESTGLRPTCFIVDNLPKHYLYQKTKKLMPFEEYSERMVPAFEVDEHGKKIPTGELEDTLQPGVEMSQSGDNAYLFFPEYSEAKNRLQQIDEYIKAHIVDPEKRKRVPYAAQPGLRNSAPVARHNIPRVVLPAPSPKAVPPASDAGTDTDSNEAKQRRAEILANARAAKAAKASK